MAKYQRGYLFEKNGAWYVRFYQNEMIGTEVRRLQRARRICAVGEKDAFAVRQERDRIMLEVNAQRSPDAAPDHDQTVIDFWDHVYLPFALEELRASTVKGYEHIWHKYLKKHFSNATLRGYRTCHASWFLTGLAKKLGRRTIAHIRSLASGIFSHAVNRGLLESNPWHDAKVLGKTKVPAGTAHYTLEEIEDIISALVEHSDCQLVMMLAFFLGLRTSEIGGLKWSDVDTRARVLSIRRACVRGRIEDTKTPESVADLPLQDERLRFLLEQQRRKSTSEWVFPNQSGDKPADLRELARHTIRPILEKANLTWKGFYAGRRGVATELVAVTGNAVAAQGLLRHKSLTTTLGFYKRETPQVTVEGLKLLEAESKKRVQRVFKLASDVAAANAIEVLQSDVKAAPGGRV